MQPTNQKMINNEAIQKKYHCNNPDSIPGLGKFLLKNSSFGASQNFIFQPVFINYCVKADEHAFKHIFCLETEFSFI